MVERIPEKFDKNSTNRFIYTALKKCKDTINSCEDEDQLQLSIDMCNTLGSTVCNILNSVDYQWVATHWNWHKKWCKQTFANFNAGLQEIDQIITERRAWIEAHPKDIGTVGFK